MAFPPKMKVNLTVVSVCTGLQLLAPAARTKQVRALLHDLIRSAAAASQHLTESRSPQRKGDYLLPYLVISVGRWRGRYDARLLLLVPPLCFQYLSKANQ